MFYRVILIFVVTAMICLSSGCSHIHPAPQSVFEERAAKIQANNATRDAKNEEKREARRIDFNSKKTIEQIREKSGDAAKKSAGFFEEYWKKFVQWLKEVFN